MASPPRTPAENHLTADQIPAYRRARKKTSFQGCTQINQLFLKSDGKLSCSCQKYWDILGDAREINAADFLRGEIMRYIRESFREGLEPFTFCGDCISRLSKFDHSATAISLHIEPTNQCNLFCEACICTFERSTSNTPPRGVLPYDLYEKFAGEIAASGLDVASVSFVGFGEPLFNSRVPDMARLTRKLFPVTNILVDTNANFGSRRARELANCGIDEVRLGIDGADQQSYVAYRKSGDFKKAITFAKELADEVRATGSKTRVTWKYILFRHNDSDEHLRTALRISNEIDVPIAFDFTVGEIASQRSLTDLQRVLGADVAINCNIDRSSFKSPNILQRLMMPNRTARILARVKREISSARSS
jgi:hypothetical protein